MAKQVPVMTKPFYQSMTIQGAVLALVPVAAQLLRHMGVPIDDQSATDVVLALIGLIGSVMAIVGRMRVSHQITLK